MKSPLTLLLLLAAPAFGHHVVTSSGINPAQPGTAVRLDLETAGFELDGLKGQWQLLALQADYTPHPAVSFGVRLPVAAVAFSSGPRTRGLADSEVSARVRLLATERDLLVLTAGAGLELPTGDPALGLGGGHFELAPFLQASSALPGDWALFAIVSGMLPVASGRGHPHGAGALHGSVIAPHTSLEAMARVGGGRAFARGFASVGLDFSQPLGAAASPRFLSARVDGAFFLTPSLRLFAGVEAPLHGVPRFGARRRIGLGWRF